MSITAAYIKAYLAGPKQPATAIKLDDPNTIVNAQAPTTQVATGSVPSAINVTPISAPLPAAVTVTLSATAKAAVAPAAPESTPSKTASAPVPVPVYPYGNLAFSAKDVNSLTSQITSGNAARALAANGQKLTLSQYGDAVSAELPSKQLATLRFQLNEAQKKNGTELYNFLNAQFPTHGLSASQLSAVQAKHNEVQQAWNTNLRESIAAVLAFDRSNGDFSGKVYNGA